MNRRTQGAILSITLAAALAGCQGHGEYTTEGKANAEERVATLKAATQWDMAQQQYNVGDLSKALKSVDHSIGLHSKVAKSHSLRGRILLELGQLESAVQSFSEALTIDATFTEAHYYLGVVNERFRDREKALEHYEAASNLDTSNAQYMVAAAEMMIELGRLDQAEAMIQNRKKDFQHNAGVRQTQGHIAMIRGEADKAVALFEEARLLAPDELTLMEDLAHAQVSAGRFAEAEYTLRRLLEKSGNEGRRDLRHAQARCLVELDRPVEARALLLQLVDEPGGQNDVKAWTDLGEIAFLLNDTNRAKLAAARLIGLAPDRCEGHLLMAAVKRRSGDLNGALTEAVKAAELSPKDARAHVLRGLLLKDMGRADESRAAFAIALSLNPEQMTAQRAFATVDPD